LDTSLVKSVVLLSQLFGIFGPDPQYSQNDCGATKVKVTWCFWNLH